MESLSAPSRWLSLLKLIFVPWIFADLLHGHNVRALVTMAIMVVISYAARYGGQLKERVFAALTDRLAFVPILLLLAYREILQEMKFPILMVVGSSFLVLKELFAMVHGLRFLRGTDEYLAPTSTRKINALTSMLVIALFALNLPPYNHIALIGVLMVAVADISGFFWNYYKRKTGIRDLNLATKITLFRLLMSPAFLIVYFYDRNPQFEDNTLELQILAILFAVSFVVTDGLDGYIARKYNQVTKFGKYLDPFSDKICTTTIFLCFVASNYVPVWMVALIYYREASISVIRTLAAAENVVMPARPSGKWKTGLQGVAILTILLLATALSALGRSTFPSMHPVLYGNLAMVWNGLPFTLMALVTLVTVLSGIDYVLASRTILDKYFK